MNTHSSDTRRDIIAATAAFSNARPLASLLCRLSGLYLLLVGATFLPWLVWRSRPAAHALPPDPALPLARAALLVSLGALLAATLIVAARARALQRAAPGTVVRAARSPQALLLCAGAVLALWAVRGAWTLHPASAHAAPLPTSAALAVPVAMLAASFLLLISERTVAGIDAASLPEAPALSAMLRLPVIALVALVLCDAVAARAPAAAGDGALGVGVLIAAAAVETALRTLKVWFAPPPTPLGARAAIGSLVITLLDPRRLSPASLSTSLNRQFGIDFARSWALVFARRALLPVLALLLCLCWALTGASRVGLNQRAVYERFGAPVAVLAPGLHLLLPWPLGRARLVEYGTVHSIVLGDSAGPQPAAPDRSTAEGTAPVSANRLWDQTGSDSSYLVARADDGRQSFEAVSVDLRVLFRIGLSPQAARDSLYRTTDPAMLIRALSRRRLSRILAGQTLSDVLVERHDQLAGGLRRDVQAQLDAAGSGIEIVGLVVDSLHPPAGAASAYRSVQAAQIAGGTAIAEEQGRARGTASIALRDAHDVRDNAQAVAAETLQTAATERTRMLAEERGWRAGGDAFLMERRFADLRAGLGRAPLEIIDSRLPARQLDLRPGASRVPSPDSTPDATMDPDQESRSP